MTVRRGCILPMLRARSCRSLCDLLQRATANGLQAAERRVASLRGLNQFLRNVFPRCVITSAVRQPATDILEYDIHIGDGALIQLCHGNGSKIPVT
jgi:hypothetical protein